MKTNHAFRIAVAAAVLALGITAFAGKPLPEVPVVSTIEGAGILPDATIPNDRVQSDLTGDYENGVDQVVSHMQGGSIGTGAGDFEMYTTDSTVRKVTVDLREPYDASATPPFPYATVLGRILVQCHLVSPASINGMHGLNTTLVCPMIVNFIATGDKFQYRLLMNRGAIPDTNDALVTCTEVSGSPTDPNAPCTAWTVDPSVIDASGPRNIARMQHALRGGGFEERGKFYLRFHISFHK
jgi:hypothetical protein